MVIQVGDDGVSNEGCVCVEGLEQRDTKITGVESHQG